jgi:AcrR family transcriptional regulator
MGAGVKKDVRESPASDGKAPRTARGERTLRKILDAARDEFGERGFSDSSIVAITQRAGVALGTFYTYFDSKESVFQALVKDMSEHVRDHVAPTFRDAADALDGERRQPNCASFSDSPLCPARQSPIATEPPAR